MQISDHYIKRVAQIESGGNPRAKATTSSALGLYQFIDATWQHMMTTHPELHLTKDGRTDPDQATRAFVAFSQDNAMLFRHGIGRDPTEPELYLCHFLGPTRAIDVVRAPLTKPLAEVLSRSVIVANSFLNGWTCAQLRMWAEHKLYPDKVAAPHGAAAPAEPAHPNADDLNDAELRRHGGEHA